MSLHAHPLSTVASTAASTPASTAAFSPRWRQGLPVLAAVLLLHAAVLGVWPGAPGASGSGEGAKTLRVRQISAPAAAPAKAPSPAPAAAVAKKATAPSRPPGLAAAPVAAQPAPTQALADAAADERTDEAAATASGAPAQAGGSAVPVYATRLPPAQSLRYTVRRGQQQGQAVLRWEREGDAFTLSMNSEWSGAPGNPALGSASRGHVTANGLAPERHTESRRGRDVRAVNFQYDSARISFSGPSVEYPLLPGAQDRLSWMLQLAAIVEANPALQAVGSEIRMFVAGSRGDGEVWLFTVQDRDDIDLPAGPLARPVHLTREPRRPYDTQVEVWLDPARGHWPVRVKQQVRPGGPGVEWLLDTLSTP